MPRFRGGYIIDEEDFIYVVTDDMDFVSSAIDFSEDFVEVIIDELDL